MRAIEMAPPIIATASETANLVEAAKLMRDKGVGDLIITRDGTPYSPTVGVVTDRDIVIHAVACGIEPEAITVADLCTRRPASVRADADLLEITAAMSEHGVRRVIVTDDSRLAGVISMDNIIEALAELMNNLSVMQARQLEYEQEHLVPLEPRRTAS